MNDGACPGRPERCVWPGCAVLAVVWPQAGDTLCAYHANAPCGCAGIVPSGAHLNECPKHPSHQAWAAHHRTKEKQR